MLVCGLFFSDLSSLLPTQCQYESGKVWHAPPCFGPMFDLDVFFVSLVHAFFHFPCIESYANMFFVMHLLFYVCMYPFVSPWHHCFRSVMSVSR